MGHVCLGGREEKINGQKMTNDQDMHNTKNLSANNKNLSANNKNLADNNKNLANNTKNL
jgi:hypothetical protein